MYNERMMPAEISIKDKKKTFTGVVVRAAVMGNTKVVQIRTAGPEDYYLLYFRKSFIFGDQLESVLEGSFIDHAFREGIVIESPHPILSVFIPKQTVAIPARNKLFPHLQAHFSSQETAYIMTTLDAFIAQSILLKSIEDIYFTHKRNGQYMKAFQILQILTSYMPELKSAKERMSSREFNSAHDFYLSSSLPAILKKDPLYVELYCFKNRTNPDVYPVFEEILKSKECYVELILLWLEKFRVSGSVEAIEMATTIALKFITIEQWMNILAAEKINPFHVLPEAKRLIDKMIGKGNYEEAAESLLIFMDDLPSTYDTILKQLWQNVGAEFVESHLDHFVKILQTQGKEEIQKQSEAQIFQLIVTMLKEYNLTTVYDKLLPLQKALPHSPLFRKLVKMVELLENPDRMMELGDYYAEFRQYDPAIECYSWEMELKPQDPDPVWKIGKMYQQKGMPAEAAAYQKVYAQLKERHESV